LQQLLSKYGTIIKREALSGSSLQQYCDNLILESKDPFPGYYCSEIQLTDNSCKEISYYLPVVAIKIPVKDKLCRISLKIQKELDIQVCQASIIIGGKYSHAIRIKGINKSSDLLAAVTSGFIENGIGFYRPRKVHTYLSEIYLKAFFEIEQHNEFIYQNAIDRNIYYLPIDESLEWKTFEHLITYQKSTIKFKNFDAVPGYWIEKPDFIDFIRIYSKNIRLDQLNIIRKDFITIMNGYFKDKAVL